MDIHKNPWGVITHPRLNLNGGLFNTRVFNG